MIAIDAQLLTPDTLDRFHAAVDPAWDATRSVVMRYRNACRFSANPEEDGRFRAQFSSVTLGEGLRVFPLLVSHGVTVDVLDSTSLMATHTHKSVDGCVTTAHCLIAGHRRIAFESGGNTGMALTVYASRAGIETFLFLPAENLALLDAETFSAPNTHVVAVEDASQVKAAAAAFSEREGVPRVPQVAWRHQASTFIGCFVLEHMLRHGRPTHLVQGISAAFAPIGIYRVLQRFKDNLGGLPAFFGVQQAPNCPMVHAWRGAGRAEAAPVVSTTGGLLARVMYDSAARSYGTFDDLRSLLLATGGDLTTLDHADFDRWLEEPIDGASPVEHLARNGLVVSRRDGEIIEKAGLMGLAGALREIASGRFASGSRLLVNITGGTAHPMGALQADRVIGARERSA